MGGAYQTSIFSQYDYEKIKAWILDNIKNDHWNDHIDLHLDEVNSLFDDSEYWVDGGVELLDIANHVLKNNPEGGKFIAIVFYSLYSDSDPVGVNFESLAELNNEFDMTPPSLFVCPKNWEKLFDSYDQKEEIYLGRVPSQKIYAYYFEELHNNELEYVRNLSISYENIKRLIASNDFKKD